MYTVRAVRCYSDRLGNLVRREEADLLDLIGKAIRVVLDNVDRFLAELGHYPGYQGGRDALPADQCGEFSHNTVLTEVLLYLLALLSRQEVECVNQKGCVK